MRQSPRYKIPVSTLVVVYTPDLDVLLIERADFPDHWQSVTGSQEPGETLAQTAARELREETGIDAVAYGGSSDWNMSQRLRNLSEVAVALSARHHAQHGARVRAGVPGRVPVTLAPREHLRRVAAVARSRGPMLFLDQPRGDRGAARPRRARKGHPMKRIVIAAVALTCASVWAADPVTPAAPTVSVSASATTSVANDRMFAWLRAEADNADPARAAAEVNARIGKAIARAKGTAGVEVTTSGYSSYQFTDKANATRWRVQQSISLEGGDFASMAALLTKMQAEDALVMSGMNFGVSRDARRKAEDNLTQQAIKAWQARAQAASKALGFDTWRVGRVSVQTGEPPFRPQPMMRMAAAAGVGRTAGQRRGRQHRHHGHRLG